MKRLSQLLFVVILFELVACAATPAPMKVSPEAIERSQFQEVWKQVISDPVNTLPQDKISYGKLFSEGKNIILENSQRTLNDNADILPPFNKLAHPNGICLKGIWNIHTENKYSGYFKKGSRGLIIVRASSAMSNTRRGEIRSFGFAGKIFPTMNPLKVNQENTANFFLIDDLGGTRADHYTDVTLTNEPTVSINSIVLKSFLYVQKIARTFSQVDKNPRIRQVYEISNLGEINSATIFTPKWMKVEAESVQTTSLVDFRDELLINDNKLVFIVSVASATLDGQKNGPKDWQAIGTITLDKSIVSKSCDHRLHFHHPKWRSDLNH